MIFVTEAAEVRAQQMLERLSADAEGWRCLYLKPMSDLPLSAGKMEALKETFQNSLGSLQGGIFFSVDGHIWAIYKNELSPTLAFKMLNDLRHQYIDGENNIEQIHVDDLKSNMIEVQARLEKSLEKLRTAEQRDSGIQVARDAPLPERFVNFLKKLPPNVTQEVATRRAAHKDPVVLAVEDDPFYGKLIERVYNTHARVIIASQAEAVMQEYTLWGPDLVLMDIGLPEVSGHQLLRAILQIDPNAYVVMASGNSARDDVMGAIHTGAKGFISKPFSREKLIRAFNQSPTIKRPIT